MKSYKLKRNIGFGRVGENLLSLSWQMLGVKKEWLNDPYYFEQSYYKFIIPFMQEPCPSIPKDEFYKLIYTEYTESDMLDFARYYGIIKAFTNKSVEELFSDWIKEGNV